MEDPDFPVLDYVKMLVIKRGEDKTPDLGDVIIFSNSPPDGGVVHSATVLGVGDDGTLFVIERMENNAPITVIGIDLTDETRSWKIYNADE